jgi:hypothetical protein
MFNLRWVRKFRMFSHFMKKTFQKKSRNLKFKLNILEHISECSS